MAKRCCRECAYAGRLRDGRRTLLVCVNCPGRLGQLTRVRPDGLCRSFHPRRKRTARRARRTPSGDDVCFVALTQGRFGMVEARDFKRLSRYKWCVSLCTRKYYARRRSKGKTIFMHREIMRPPKNMVVDHVEGNGMNNCRSALRVCTRLENGHNSKPSGRSSRFKGVSYNDALDTWEAAICIDSEMVSIDHFDTEIEAARAYDRVARKVHGIHAYLNFPDEHPPPGRRRQTSGCRSKRSDK